MRTRPAVGWSSVTTVATVDADVLQAQYFLAELQRASDTLTRQIEHIQGGHGDARKERRCRAELHEVRRQLAAIRHRFADQI